MNDMTGSHAPRPEFRARLEDDVVRTFQRESQFVAERRSLDPRRIRGISLLLAGLILGFSTEFASGQVQEARERDRILQAAESTRQLALLRLSFAEEALKLARGQFDIGVGTREALQVAEAEFRSMRMQVVRIDLELAETRVSAAPPRDELWAPLVGGRDFVSDRLKVDAGTVQEELRTAEQRLGELQRGQSVGVTPAALVADAESALEDARSQLERLGVKLNLRKKFLDEGLATDEVARQLRRYELMFEMKDTERALRRAQRRMERALERSRAGTATELDAKRAEVEVLELSLKLRQLQLQYREFDTVRKQPDSR